METNHCPTCHVPIPANAPGGFCPACLLRDAEEPPTHGHSAPPLEEIAAAFPQWEVIELIGQGGMGFVYKIRQPGLDRIVALKILSPELGRDPAFAERFAREARTLGKLHHPNIVTVFEHGEKDGFFYLLMEYVDGVNLRQALRAGRFTPQQALSIVPGICDALQYAHENGVWHRDIKPENILLDRDGKVKIADFGIARIVGDPRRDFTLTMTGNALGSAAYMAPEQHEKPHDVDHRADIYSLGVVIYEMLTGELPLGRFPSPSQKTAVDARIDEIVLRTLEKEREMRQQSATEVKTQVHNALQSGSMAERRPAKTATTDGPSLLSKLAAGCLLGGTLGFPLLMGFGMRQDYAATFFVLAVLLGLILGLMSWRERPGKFAVFASLCLFVAGILFLTWNTSPTKAEPGPIQPRPVPAQPRAVVVPPAREDPEFTGPFIPPAESVEQVLRKMVAAANGSDVEGFQTYMSNATWKENRKGMQNNWVASMTSFLGEITRIRVTAGAPKDPRKALAYITIRRADGSFQSFRISLKYANDGKSWLVRDVGNPDFRSSARIEFRPEGKDPESILKLHLRTTRVDSYRKIDGMTGVFEFVHSSSNAEFAKVIIEETLAKLQASLKPFGLDSALKVISPPVEPAAPYLGEDEPEYQYPKP
jgi:serine/threonine protein kinase